MRKKWLALTLLAIFISAVLSLVLFTTAGVPIINAQNQATAEDAIKVAAAHPAFLTALELRPGWRAAAFNTYTRYDVWRVQFWDASGEDMGFADVDPVRGIVYAYEPHYGATTEQVNAAQEVLREFVAQHPDFRALLDDPAQYAIYIDYDGWNRWWGVYVDVGADSLYAVIQFEGGGPESLSNPRLLRILFANVPSFDEWYAATEEQAIAVAFNQPEVATALHGRTDWQAAAEPVEGYDGTVWTVYFTVGEEMLAQATVNPIENTVLDFFVW